MTETSQVVLARKALEMRDASDQAREPGFVSGYWHELIPETEAADFLDLTTRSMQGMRQRGGWAAIFPPLRALRKIHTLQVEALVRRPHAHEHERPGRGGRLMPILHFSPQSKNPPAATSGLSISLAVAKGHTDNAYLHFFVR